MKAWKNIGMTALLLAGLVGRRLGFTVGGGEHRQADRVAAAKHLADGQPAAQVDPAPGGRRGTDVRRAAAVGGHAGGRHRWAFEVLDAVHRGLIDAAHAWPGYWAGKHPAAGLYGPPPGGPFGLGREEFIAWLFAGEGADLYNELLQKELGLDVVALFTTGLPYWEAFGWVRKPFASLDDLRQLKYRTSGLGMEMMQNMGVSVVTLPGAEVLPALERGAVDGAEWAIPSHDILIGFHNVTKYYYMPDLRQPASLQDLLINTSVWEALPDDLKAIVRSACLAEIIRMAAVSVDMESKAVAELTGRYGVEIMQTPDDVLKAELEAMDKVFEVESAKSPFFARVLESQRTFAERAVPHARRLRPPMEIVVPHYWGQAEVGVTFEALQWHGR